MYVTLTKKKLFVILCTLLAVLILLLQFFSVKAERVKLVTNAQRVEYINSLGVKLLSDDYRSKTVVIPKEFDSVYNNYNKLQLTANLDLTAYKGKKVTVYTYDCANETVVNLMIYKDRLIGGDIAETRFRGSMKPLKGDTNG